MPYYPTDPDPEEPWEPKKHPGEVEELKIQGIQLFDSGDYKNALYCFMDALDIDTTDYDLYYYRGCTFLKLEKYDNAIDDLDYYLFFFVKDKDALYNPGACEIF